jgi:hypothetical protein
MSILDHSPPTRWSRRRRKLAAVGVAAAAVAGTVAVSAGPASAAPVSVTGASFQWDISTEVAAKAPPFGGCNYLSAGASDGTSAQYQVTAGDVAIVRTDGATPTYATRCTGVGSPFQKVNWTGGTGTVDPDTGAATLSFTGELSVNFYGGLVPFTIKDPVVTVGADGSTTVVATMYGWESSMEDPSVKVPVAPVTGVVVADASGVDAGSTGFTINPAYAGVTYDVPSGQTGTPQNRTNAGWGSWPSSFVDFHYLTGLTSYWYSSGGAADPFKAPTPITVSYADVGGDPDPDPDPEPTSDSQVITVTVPEVTEPGEFVWSITGDGDVAMTEAADQGTYLGSTGAIDPIAVTDTRTNGPAWSISGQVGDFTGGLSGQYLGWTPEVTSAGAGATAGSAVAPGNPTGDGLTVASTLASATAGHAGGSAVLGADLDLRLPVETPAGTYSATLTLTALS